MEPIYRIIFSSIFFLISFTSLAQCPGGQVEVTVAVETDSWGYESFWDVTPAGAGCGNGTILSFGNIAQIGCSGAGNQDATGGNGYGSNATTIENLGCLTIENCYDINFVDDWGDGGSTFTVTIMGIVQGPFVGSGVGNVFNFCVTVPFINNVAVKSEPYTYTKMPLSQVGNIIKDASIISVGAGNVTGANLSVQVFKESNLLYSTTSTPQNVAAGTTSNFTVAGFTPFETGTYSVVYTASILEVDEDFLDNTYSFTLEVSDSIFARDNGINDVGGMGIGGNLSGYMGNIFELNAGEILSSASALLDNSTFDITGKTFELALFALDNSGVPSALLATSESATIGGINQWYDLRFSPPLSLSAGNYLLAIKQDSSYQQQIGASSSISTAGTCWVSWTNQPWTLAETFDFHVTLMLRANFNEFAAIPSLEKSSFTIFPNPAEHEITLTHVLEGSTLEIYSTSGQLVHVEIVKSSNASVQIEKLEPGMYTLKLTSGSHVSCAKFIKN
jgi:hypothetical protein